MEDGPGPSKKVKYSRDKHRKLTEAELLALLYESDDERDPYENSSDNDPDYLYESDDNAEDKNSI